MPVLLKSGQSASREEAVEEMKDCRSTVLKPYLCIEFLQPLAGHRPLNPRWKEPWFPGSPLKGTQEGSNLNYVIVVVDEHDELPEATQREAEIQRQIDDLQGQITGLHRTREETHPELSLEFQILKEKLNEHSKQLEQSAEKLSQLELENLTLRDENQSLNAANKKRRFRTWRGLLPDGDLYKELTKYQCKTMEDILSQALAHVKWEEDVASLAKVQQKQDPKAIR
ncbi:hypothetical protein F2Q70_00003723 [Brassica cretica]|uniref:Uncharacterized protein n=1 Tax=Brassica cretica TaxID=69181 RepID=A0A8S9IYX0_BRACR|nr:hypothetical protein F2Q70_00003723 [Brassica cretica]